MGGRGGWELGALRGPPSERSERWLDNVKTAVSLTALLDPMDSDNATFHVKAVMHITGRTDTYLAGKIQTGTVRIGMQAKVLVDGGLFMVATINRIEGVRDTTGESNLALALDTPEEDVRYLWKELCRAGEILTIENVKGESGT